LPAGERVPVDRRQQIQVALGDLPVGQDRCHRRRSSVA
jgi:hypothetical protein